MAYLAIDDGDPRELTRLSREARELEVALREAKAREADAVERMMKEQDARQAAEVGILYRRVAQAELAQVALEEKLAEANRRLRSRGIPEVLH